MLRYQTITTRRKSRARTIIHSARNSNIRLIVLPETALDHDVVLTPEACARPPAEFEPP